MPTTEFGQMLSASLADVDLSNPINYSHPLANGLVGFWMPLPSLSGGMKLYDLAWSRSHVSLSGTNPSSFWIQSPHGLAVETDGSDDYGATNDARRLSITGDMTFMIRAIDNQADSIGPVVLSKGYSYEYDFRVNHYIAYFYCGDGTSYNEVNVSIGLNVSQPYTVCITRRAVTSGWEFKFFANDQLVGLRTGSVPVVSGPYYTHFFARVGPSNYWSGSVFSIGLWNRCLSECEVRLIFRESTEGYHQLLNRRRFWYPKQAISGKAPWHLFNVAS